MTQVEEVTIDTLHLLEKSVDIDASERWNLPFPMGVFGTLRNGQWNNGRMKVAPIARHYKAFMPHFIATGLSISFKEGSSAPFEIFCYTPENWQRMIGGVDSLEGFRPKESSYRAFGYYRTLAWLRILPDNYEHELFPNTERYLKTVRDLGIPQEEWEKYERVPAWVYSSVRQNEAAAASGSIIWG